MNIYTRLIKATPSLPNKSRRERLMEIFTFDYDWMGKNAFSTSYIALENGFKSDAEYYADLVIRENGGTNTFADCVYRYADYFMQRNAHYYNIFKLDYYEIEDYFVLVCGRSD